MLVKFTTDTSVSENKGFLATYSNGGPTGIILKFYYIRFAIKLTSIFLLKLIAGTLMYTTLGCRKTYIGMAGNITSLHYPGNYSDSLDFRYSIDLRNAGASSASLTFRDFQTSYVFKLAVY